MSILECNKCFKDYECYFDINCKYHNFNFSPQERMELCKQFCSMVITFLLNCAPDILTKDRQEITKINAMLQWYLSLLGKVHAKGNSCMKNKLVEVVVRHLGTNDKITEEHFIIKSQFFNGTFSLLNVVDIVSRVLHQNLKKLTRHFKSESEKLVIRQSKNRFEHACMTIKQILIDNKIPNPKGNFHAISAAIYYALAFDEERNDSLNCSSENLDT